MFKHEFLVTSIILSLLIVINEILQLQRLHDEKEDELGEGDARRT